MRYVHSVTGAVIDVDSIMGGDWRAEKPAAVHAAPKAGEVQKEPVPEKAVPAAKPKKKASGKGG